MKIKIETWNDEKSYKGLIIDNAVKVDFCDTTKLLSIITENDEHDRGLISVHVDTIKSIEME